MDQIKALADMIRSARHIVFFGGAGVSTESGMKDYRSKDGIYNTAKNYGYPPERILSHSFFFSHTDIFYDFYREYFLTDAEPNFVHRFLAELEKNGKRVSVVTQNIDGLHQKAGSREVYELHGTTSRLRCCMCGREYGTDAVSGSSGIPKCECGGTLKPLVVLYEEMLDEDVISGAVDVIEHADLMIIGGTSLAVYPAASFVRYFTGDNMVIINKEETPYDDRCDLVFHDSLGDVFRQVSDLI